MDKVFPLLLKKKPKISDVAKAFGFLGGGFTELGEVVKQCKKDVKESHEVQVFLAMTDMFKHASAKDIAMKTGKNLVFNGVDIFRELSAAYTNYLAQ